MFLCWYQYGRYSQIRRISHQIQLVHSFPVKAPAKRVCPQGLRREDLACRLQPKPRLVRMINENAINGHNLRALASRIIGRPVKLHVMGPTVVHMLGLIFPPVRGLKETQYLWNEPVTLSMAKFARRFNTSFLHSHREALEEILAIGNG